MRYLVILLPLKSKLSGNFSISVLLVEVPKSRNKAEFPRISVKRKNFKVFYEVQTASRLKEIIQPTTS